MIREIITAEQGFIQIQLPEEFIGKLIEIIAFPIAEKTQAHTVFQMKPVKKRVTVVSVKNKSYKFNRAELYDR